MTLSNTEDIIILNQLIDDEEGVYRIKIGDKVGYLTIPVGTFDDDTMSRPYLLIPQLPKLPRSHWTKIRLEPGSGEAPLNMTIDDSPLPELEGNWHPNYIDILSLERNKRHRSNVHEVVYKSTPAIAKLAPFEWDFPRIENETWAYWVLDEYQRRHPNESSPCPKFIGHLTENGRRMGLLLEKKEGVKASLEDLESCECALRKLHSMGLVHGDVNRYNFIIDKEGGEAFLVDLEHAEEYDADKAASEIESLTAELSEKTGRGGTTIRAPG